MGVCGEVAVHDGGGRQLSSRATAQETHNRRLAMKTWKIAVPAVLACALAVSSVNAATTAAPSSGMPLTFGIGAGLGLPTGDLGDAVKSGWNVGGQGDWWMNPTWGVGLDLGYHTNNLKFTGATSDDKLNSFQ